jgi:hypothetical protein
LSVSKAVRKANIIKNVAAHVFSYSLKGMIVASGILPLTTLIHPEHRTPMFLTKAGMK